MSDSGMEVEKIVEKWRAPVMEADPSRVLRHRETDDASIPTVADIESLRRQAEEEGFQQGLIRAQQEAGELQQRLLKLIEFFENPLQSLNEDIEHQLTQLAVTLAQQLVRRELKIEPGEIIGLIRDSVKLLPGNTRNITILLHPEDARLVRNALSLEPGDEEHNWKLVEDPMITRGGCQISAPPSSINATLENRLSELAASVLGGEREQD
ncbi:MAG: flagellar assembly protein FliH [Gammaproteobacteria bacterium]|nr:flagellar assembly protein FliH [Gammaproteobacteria bacterium]